MFIPVVTRDINHNRIWDGEYICFWEQPRNRINSRTFAWNYKEENISPMNFAYQAIEFFKTMFERREHGL